MNEHIRKLQIPWRSLDATRLPVPHELRFPLLTERPLPALRTRAAMLLELNERVFAMLPTVDFRGWIPLRNSMAHLLRTMRGLILYPTKLEWIHANLTETAHRRGTEHSPEITLDPLEAMDSNMVTSAAETQFMQSLLQLEGIDPARLRVPLARGGDPVFPMLVRFSGEQVRGNSGSFRDFLGRMANELRNGSLPLLITCPSANRGHNVGRMLIRPGPLTFPLSRMFEFLGQLIGIALRADVPLPVDLLPSVWKSLIGLPLSAADLAEADVRTVAILKELRRSDASDTTLTELVAQEHLPPAPIELEWLGHEAASGSHPDSEASPTVLCMADRESYASALEAIRMEELASQLRVDAVRRGMATVVPLELFVFSTWRDMELRVCGEPDISLELLRINTSYNVGISETDAHVVFFWNVLGSFSPAELQAFVKFACNQERLPSTLSMKEGVATHVPPYPMKIAPPDGRGRADSQFIRAETCMFLLKLPQYSTQELMKKRLLYAIHCREDPLSG